jgi:hypothetical protein
MRILLIKMNNLHKLKIFTPAFLLLFFPDRIHSQEVYDLSRV